MQSNDALQKYAKEINSINLPPPRFGHTVNFYKKSFIVLFGGSIKFDHNNNSYIMSSDLFYYNMSQLLWKKLESQKQIKARAVHASANINDNTVAYYGGLSNKGQFADDNLWSFEIRWDETVDWIQIHTTGKTPGPRYGHSMAFMHNNLFLYGGYSISSNSSKHKKRVIMNDIWIFNIDTTRIWIKLNMEDNPLIVSRLYHTFCVYTKINRENDIIVLFGGRDSHDKSLNDLFSLTKKGNNYIWEIQTTKNKEYIPISRYQHSAAMFGPFLFIMGGKSTDSNITNFDVFSFLSNSWYNFGNVYLYRHTIWIYLNDSNPNEIKLNLYIYGGFDGKHNHEFNTKLYNIDIFKLFSEKEELKNQLKFYLLILKNNNLIKWNAIIDPCSMDPNNNIRFQSNENNYRNAINEINDNINKNNNNNILDNIDMLEEKKITKDIIKTGVIKRCTICLEDYSIGNFISYLPCCHSFHSKCIKLWLHKTKKCPLCKIEMI